MNWRSTEMSEWDSVANLEPMRVTSSQDEIQSLKVDLLSRVSAAATSEIIDIYQEFIENGFTWTGHVPRIMGNVKHRQQLMLGSVMAAFFYAERQIFVAAHTSKGPLTPILEVSSHTCEILFNFAQDLAAAFKAQMVDLPHPSIPNRRLNLH